MTLAESLDGLLLATVQVYLPPVVTDRVWLYCAVTGSTKTVSALLVTVTESLVQVTVVAGPPVEIQVRMSRYSSNIKGPDMTITPSAVQKKQDNQ